MYHTTEHWLLLDVLSWNGIFELLRSPGIDSKEWILPADVAWRAVYDNLFLLGS